MKKNKEQSLDLQTIYKFVWKGKTESQVLFLVRDFGNRILITTNDRNIIMLNIFHGSNEYESDVPRLIHGLKSSGYDMPFVIYLTKGDKRGRESSIRNYVYEGCIYQIETIAIQYV